MPVPQGRLSRPRSTSRGQSKSSIPRDVSRSLPRQHPARDLHHKDPQEEYSAMRRENEAMKEDVKRLKADLEGKEDEVRNLRIHVLKLNDFIDTASVQSEEEKNQLRRQIDAESRSYRTRNSNMTQLLSQLRQDVLDEKIRYDDLKADYDRNIVNAQDILQQASDTAQQKHDITTRLRDTTASLQELEAQREIWTVSEKTWAERVERAEKLVIEMEQDYTNSMKAQDRLKDELETSQIKAEELQLQLLQGQRKESELRMSLSELSGMSEELLQHRKEVEELRARDIEHRELITELRNEKHRMLQHLQTGIKERQQIIDSIGTSGAVNPQLQLKIIETESLRAELASFVQKAEEEAATMHEYTEVLKAKATSAEETSAALRDDNRRLQVELELTKEEIKNVYHERERAKQIREELGNTWEKVTVLRDALEAKQASFNSFFSASPVGDDSPASKQ